MSKKRCKPRPPRAETQRMPDVVTQEAPTETRDSMFFAADGEECVYHKRKLTHCPRCKRVRRNDRSQAVVARTTLKDVAYLRCRECGLHFAAPIR